MRGKAVIGITEIKRLVRGDSIVVRVKPETTELEIKFSLPAQGEVRHHGRDQRRDLVTSFERAVEDVLGRR